MTHEKMNIIGNESALPLRGGDFWDGAGAGVFALELDHPRALSTLSVGFRAAFLS